MGGWLIKLILGHINDLKSNHEKLLIKHIEDMESLLEKHTNLALSMPEKYVRSAIAKKMHHHVVDSAIHITAVHRMRSHVDFVRNGAHDI